MLSAQSGQAQLTVAASISKTNAGHDAEIVQMLQSGQQNLANLAPGTGQNLNISV